MRRYAIVEAPSVLGTAAEFDGVRLAPEALLAAGLADAIGGRVAARVEAPSPTWDRVVDMPVPNAAAIRDYAFRLADAVGGALSRGEFPVVLGGDCSILLGSLLAAARRGRHGVVFVDGHIDFYPPDGNEWDGRAANSELAFAAGRGPALLTEFGLGRALVRDEDIAAIGFRDHANQAKYGVTLPPASSAWSREDVRRYGAAHVAGLAVAQMTRPDGPQGYFIHLDADAIDGALMPAVDDPSPDGFEWDEAVAVVRGVAGDRRAIGLQLTIYNPAMDPEGSAARTLITILSHALGHGSPAP